MKMVWAAAVLLLVVFLGITGISLYTSQLHNDLHENLHEIERAAREESWERAKREAGTLEQLWNRADRFWSPVMDHKDIDRVDEVITRVVSLARERRQEELLTEIVVARRLITRLKEREYPNLRNVF